MIKENIFSYVDRGQHEELVKAISNAVNMLKDAIPLELSEALHEYLEIFPEQKEIEIMTASGKNISLSEIEDNINRRTEDGIDYTKSLYRMSFEDIVKARKKI